MRRAALFFFSFLLLIGCGSEDATTSAGACASSALVGTWAANASNDVNTYTAACGFNVTGDSGACSNGTFVDNGTNISATYGTCSGSVSILSNKTYTLPYTITGTQLALTLNSTTFLYTKQ